jgi:hypothetical protein
MQREDGFRFGEGLLLLSWIDNPSSGKPLPNASLSRCSAGQCKTRTLRSARHIALETQNQAYCLARFLPLLIFKFNMLRFFKEDWWFIPHLFFQGINSFSGQLNRAMQFFHSKSQKRFQRI